MSVTDGTIAFSGTMLQMVIMATLSLSITQFKARFVDTLQALECGFYHQLSCW